MSDDAFYPGSRAPWDAGRRFGDVEAMMPEERQRRFARVLNGHQWRLKPNAPPREPDDNVPND